MGKGCGKASAQFLGCSVIANIRYRQGARKIIFHQGRSKTVDGSRGNGIYKNQVLNGRMLLFKSFKNL